MLNANTITTDEELAIVLTNIGFVNESSGLRVRLDVFGEHHPDLETAPCRGIVAKQNQLILSVVISVEDNQFKVHYLDEYNLAYSLFDSIDGDTTEDTLRTSIRIASFDEWTPADFLPRQLFFVMEPEWSGFREHALIGQTAETHVRGFDDVAQQLKAFLAQAGLEDMLTPKEDNQATIHELIQNMESKQTEAIRPIREDLERWGMSFIVHLLADKLDHPTVHLQAKALQVLRVVGAAIYGSLDVAWQNALKAIESSPRTRILDYLINALGDQNLQVRYEAFRALEDTSSEVA
jgi:hypothetical protein